MEGEQRDPSTQMVAIVIERDSYGPWTVQAGTDVETHEIFGPFEEAYHALRFAAAKARNGTRPCFVLDRDGTSVMSYEGRSNQE